METTLGLSLAAPGKARGPNSLSKVVCLDSAVSYTVLTKQSCLGDIDVFPVCVFPVIFVPCVKFWVLCKEDNALKEPG